MTPPLEDETCGDITYTTDEDQSVGIADPNRFDCDEHGLTCYLYDGTWAYDGSIPYC